MKRTERRPAMSLLRSRCVRYNDGRDRSRQARGEQFSGEGCEIVSGHVDDERSVLASDFLPIRLVRSRLGRAMAAHQDYPGAFATVGERDTQGGRRGRTRGDPRHHFEGHIGRFESVDFFGKPTEDRRIAAMQTNNAQTAARSLNHSLVDFRLGDALGPTTLAYVLHSGVRPGESQDRIRDEVVVKHDIGPAQQALRFDRQ